MSEDKTADFIQAVNSGKVSEYVEANRTDEPPVETPVEATPDSVVDPEVPVEPQVETTEVVTEPPVVVDNPLKSIFGEEYNEAITPDGIKQAYKGWQQAQQETAQLREKLAFYQDVENLIENPYPNERIARLAAAERVLKIDDPSVVGYVSAATETQMIADPVTAVAVQKALANPTLLQKGVTFDDLKAAAQEELSYEEGVELTAAQRIKVKEAIHDITQKQGELKLAPTDFKQLVDSRRQAVQVDRTGLIQELSPLADTVTADVIKEFQAAGIPVSPDSAKLKEFASNLIAHHVNGGAKKSDITPGMVSFFVRQHAIELSGGISGIGSSVKSYVDAQVKAAIEKERKSAHNGGTIQKPVAPGSQSGDKTGSFVAQMLENAKKATNPN
jgi:hypothetical protein